MFFMSFLLINFVGDELMQGHVHTELVAWGGSFDREFEFGFFMMGREKW